MLAGAAASGFASPRPGPFGGRSVLGGWGHRAGLGRARDCWVCLVLVTSAGMSPRCHPRSVGRSFRVSPVDLAVLPGSQSSVCLSRGVLLVSGSGSVRTQPLVWVGASGVAQAVLL